MFEDSTWKKTTVNSSVLSHTTKVCSLHECNLTLKNVQSLLEAVDHHQRHGIFAGRSCLHHQRPCTTDKSLHQLERPCTANNSLHFNSAASFHPLDLLLINGGLDGNLLAWTRSLQMNWNLVCFVDNSSCNVSRLRFFDNISCSFLASFCLNEKALKTIRGH